MLRGVEEEGGWQARGSGRLVLYVRPRSHAERDIDELAHRYHEALALVSGALAMEADALPSIAVYIADQPPDEAEMLSQGADAAGLAEAGLSDDAAAIAVWTVHSPEDLPIGIEAELTHALLANSYGAPSHTGRFWDEGLAGYLAARSGRSPYHAEATAHARQLLHDGILPPIGELVAESADRVSALASTAACSFAEYLIERHGLPQYQTLLRAGREGDSDVFEAVYRTPLAIMDRDWRRALEASGRDAEPALWATLRRLLPMARPYWRSGIAIVACTLVGIAFSLSLPLSVRFLVDNVLGRRPLREGIPLVGPAGYAIMPGQEQFDALLGLLGFLGLLYVLNGAARLWMNVLLSAVGESFVLDLRRKLAERLERLPAAFFARTTPADISQRIVQDTASLQQVITRAAVPLFSGTLSIVLYAVLLTTLEPKLALVTLVGLPILAVIAVVRRRGRRAAAREQVRRLSDLASTVQESASAHLLAKLYRSGPYFVERLLRRFEVHRQLNIAFGRETSFLGQVGTLVIGLTQVSVLLVGGYLIVASDGRDLAPGGLMAFYITLNQLLGPIGQMTTATQTVAGASASMERVASLLAEPVEVNRPGAIALAPLGDRIRFDGVGFAFPGGRPILKGVTFEIRAGSVVAFVGPTGAGKSSIVHLLPRLREPTSGTVTWDGADLKEAHLDSLRAQVILVPQDSILVGTTVYENIRLGLEGASDEDVRRVAGLARADEFIDQLPLGYDTIVGERGMGLSGGQRQRLALARALLRDPSILILDEATSALDATTQRAVHENLRADRPSRTLIKVAHRLETVVDADTIFVLEDGRLVEQGTHADLLACGGLYARLFEDQMGTLRGTSDPLARDAARRLARLAPFSAMPSETLDRLAGALQRRDLKGGQTIYQDGSQAEELFILARGRAEMLLTLRQGDGRDKGAAPSSGGTGTADRPGRDPVRGQRRSGGDGIGFKSSARVIDTLGPGATFGVTTFLNGRPRTVTARAATDVVLFALDRPSYQALLAEVPAVEGRIESA